MSGSGSASDSHHDVSGPGSEPDGRQGPQGPGSGRAETGEGGQPEFGPPGYLPERAAQRARKIVLRSPLGLSWVIGSLAAGVVIAVAAAIFLAQAGDPPGPPFEEVGPLEAVGEAHLDEERAILYVGAVGTVRAFDVDPDDVPVFCAPSGQLEAPSGRVWSATGRALDGGDSLRQHPTIVVDGVLYVDPSRSEAAGTPEDVDPERACV